MRTKAEILRETTDKLVLGKYCPNKLKTIQKLDSTLATIWKYAWERCESYMMPTVRAAIQIGELKERERIRFTAKYDERRNVYTVDADILNLTRNHDRR